MSKNILTFFLNNWNIINVKFYMTNDMMPKPQKPLCGTFVHN